MALLTKCVYGAIQAMGVHLFRGGGGGGGESTGPSTPRSTSVDWGSTSPGVGPLFLPLKVVGSLMIQPSC